MLLFQYLDFNLYNMYLLEFIINIFSSFNLDIFLLLNPIF